MQARPMRENFLRPLGWGGGKCPFFSKISKHEDSVSLKLPVTIFGINWGNLPENEAYKEESRTNIQYILIRCLSPWIQLCLKLFKLF